MTICVRAWLLTSIQSVLINPQICTSVSASFETYSSVYFRGEKLLFSEYFVISVIEKFVNVVTSFSTRILSIGECIKTLET